MGVGMGGRSVAIATHRTNFRIVTLTGAVIAGLALGFATRAHAACSGADCATAPAATAGSSKTTEAPGRPVKLNTFSKRASKSAAVTKRKVAKSTAAAGKFATRRAAKYSRVASRVQKASRKFTVASNAATPAISSPALSAPIPQPRMPSAVSTFAGDSLKPLVADARAEMSAADLKAAGASPAPVVVVDAGVSDAQPMQVAAADQVNDIDRAAAANEAANTKPGQILKPVSPQRASIVSTDSAWDQTSWIGKLFVAFGGILTLASAARMFMA